MEAKKIGLNKKAIFVFIMIGILFLVAGVFIHIIRDEVPYGGIISTICLSMGIIFITTMVTEWFLIIEFRKQVAETTELLFDKYRVEAQEAIGRQLNALFELLRNAKYCGLINVLPPRRDSSIDEDSDDERGLMTAEIIRESLERAENVKIICISGREFLWPRLSGGFYDVFQNKSKNNIKYRVKMLLADPEGYAVKIRGRKEDPIRPDYIRDDVETSRDEREVMEERISLMWEISPNWSIEIRYYNFVPQAWIVITDDEMFIEPYHMADTKTLKDEFPKKFTDNDVCCGGRVPIFVVEKGSFLYVAMDNYFDWLWMHSNRNIFTPEFEDCFNVREL